jgi:hypothetical protein
MLPTIGHQPSRIPSNSSIVCTHVHGRNKVPSARQVLGKGANGEAIGEFSMRGCQSRSAGFPLKERLYPEGFPANYEPSPGAATARCQPDLAAACCTREGKPRARDEKRRAAGPRRGDVPVRLGLVEELEAAWRVLGPRRGHPNSDDRRLLALELVDGATGRAEDPGGRRAGSPARCRAPPRGCRQGSMALLALFVDPSDARRGQLPTASPRLRLPPSTRSRLSS